MTYTQVLEYLYSKLPMYSRIGAVAYKKDLSRTIRLCQYLEHPQKKLKCIHIAGTNGKGSVTHMVASALIAQGYRVGIYTSPHYKDFRERIKINSKYIPKKIISQFIQKHKITIEEIEPSFFELTVVIAFHYFAEQKVDYAVIETGLGGRLDSTNVITPLVSVITNISLDHTDLLGETLQEIAFEKAGIIKQSIPVVVGRTQVETENLFIQKANTYNSKIHFADQEIQFQKTDNTIFIPKYNINFEADQLGPYQSENYRTAFQCLIVLMNSGILITLDNIENGFQNIAKFTGMIGRWQWKKSNLRILLDSAHNEDGIAFLTEWIQKQKFKQLKIVCGFVKDKSLDHILQLFPQQALYYFTQAKIPRALSSNELLQKGKSYGLHGKAYRTVSGALASAKRNSSSDDLIIVCGSIFVVAEVI